MMILSRTFGGPFIEFVHADEPMDGGCVWARIDREATFFEMSLELLAAFVQISEQPAVFEEYDDCHFMNQPRPQPEPPADTSLDFIGPDGQLQPIGPLEPSPDQTLQALQNNLMVWHKAIMATEPARVADRLADFYDTATTPAAIKADMLETLDYLARETRQASDQDGVIIVVGV